MRKIYGPLMALLFVGFFTMAGAQNLQDVLDKHFEAIGQETLLAKETYSVKATVEQMGMKIPMDMKMKRPDKFRMVMEMQGQKMIQVFDGEKGWVLAPWVSSEPQELSGAQLEQAMQQADIDGELYRYEANGSTAELLGKEFIDDLEVFNIKLVNADGTEKNYYIDSEDYFIRKVKGKVKSQGREMSVEQNMGNYTEIDGVMMALEIESKSPVGTARIVFEEVKFGETFDDAIFQKP